MPSPFADISNVLKSALDGVDSRIDPASDQPEVTHWPDHIDTGAILEAADDVVINGQSASDWAGQMAERAADIAAKYEASHDGADIELVESAEAVIDDQTQGAGSRIMETIQTVGGKLIDAIEARIEAQDEVIEATPEDDVYDAAPAEVDAADADDDPYDSDTDHAAP